MKFTLVSLVTSCVLAAWSALPSPKTDGTRPTQAMLCDGSQSHSASCTDEEDAAASPAMALAALPLPNPNGTRPTKVTNLAVVAVGANQMRTTGRYTDLQGHAIAGMEVKVWSVSASNFTSWATVYTDNNGNFSVLTSKVPVGNKVQVEVQGNGANSRPYPLFARP